MKDTFCASSRTRVSLFSHLLPTGKIRAAAHVKEKTAGTSPEVRKTEKFSMNSMNLPKPEKIGAGLLLHCGDQALVLLRTSKHNNNTWGLPGGNSDASDNNLFETAKREAIEEMGHLPEFLLKGKVLTVRGKRNQKHYTVFMCEISSEAKAAYIPQLNYEHSTWKWFPMHELKLRQDLHPVVASLLRENWPETSSWLSLTTPAPITEQC